MKRHERNNCTGIETLNEINISQLKINEELLTSIKMLKQLLEQQVNNTSSATSATSTPTSPANATNTASAVIPASVTNTASTASTASTSNTVSTTSIMDETEKGCMELEESVESDGVKVLNKTIDNSITNITNITTNNITTNVSPNIYISLKREERSDILRHLSRELGEKEALEYLLVKLYKGEEGDIDCIKKLYMNGSPDMWPIRCIDKKRLIFELKDKNNVTYVDKGGELLYSELTNMLQNAYLQVLTSRIKDSCKEGDEVYRDATLFGALDYKKAQNRCNNLTKVKKKSLLQALADITFIM